MYFWGGKGYAEIKARNWALKLLFGYAAAIIIVIIPFDVFLPLFSPFSLTAGNRVMCFNCNSHEDYRCRDSFNWTDPPEKKACEGCCVKMVQGIGTGEDKRPRDWSPLN